MFQAKVVEKLEAHFSCSVMIFFFNLALYEITWKKL